MNLQLITIAIFVIALSYLLEEKNKWLGHVSGVLLIILTGILLGNAKIVSSSEAVYAPVFKWAVPLGIAMMLMTFNPKQVLRVRKEYILCFVIGTIASVIGGLVAGYVFRPVIQQHAWQVAGQLTASYVGGYENAAAIGNALNIPSAIFITAFAGDSIFTAAWMIINIVHGKLLTKNGNVTQANKKSAINELIATFDISTLALILATAIALVFAATELHELFSSIPKVIWLSLLATGLTFFPWRDRFQGSYVIGSLILSLFFFACGAISNIKVLFNSSALLVFFPGVIVSIHAIILFTFARFLKIDRNIAIVTSQTLIGGPATALAVVQAVRWDSRFEAIVLGLLGYAVANYIGYSVAWSLLHF